MRGKVASGLAARPIPAPSMPQLTFAPRCRARRGWAPARLQIPEWPPITPVVETPSFTFRLERVKSLRERAEERAREDLAHELQLRLRGEAMLREATHVASAATQAGGAARPGPAGGRGPDRQDAEVAARRVALQAAARDRQVMDKLEQRQRADHDREWARKAQGAQDEIALGVHRRGQVAA